MGTDFRRITLSIITCLFTAIMVNGQNITLRLNEMKQLGQTADSAIVSDVNGEICSMAIIYDSTPGLKFYTNLSIEKVSKDSLYYTVWFPANASVLRIAVPGFPLLEHSIERRTSPTIYFFILDIPETQIISSYETATAFNKITITSTPGDARVYQNSFKGEKIAVFNSIYVGRTPVSLDYLSPDQTAVIIISKSGYAPSLFSWDTITPGLSYHYNLKKASHQKQWFLSATTGGMEDFPAYIWGVQVGTLGKLGFYSSGKMSFSKLLSSGYSLSLGLTKSITKAAHIKLGYGICSSEGKEPNEYGEEYDSTNSIFFDIGVIFRVGTTGNTLLLAQTSFVPGKESAFFDYSAGIGFAF
jgi:hypothetical protein